MKEKAPWFALAVCSAFITALGASKSPVEALSLPTRVASALVAYVNYLGKMAWPHDLAVLYPHSGAPPTWQVIGAILVLGVITAWVLWALPYGAYGAVGWFWYLGMLVPVIGVIQLSWISMADRFTYFPIIGVMTAIAWGARDLYLRDVGAVARFRTGRKRVHQWESPTGHDDHGQCGHSDPRSQH